MKTTDLSVDDRTRFIDESLELLLRYSSSCFTSMSPLNVHLDVSILQLLNSFGESQLSNRPLIEKCFQCLTNVLQHRDSIADVTWARHGRDVGCSPLRMFFQLSKTFPQFKQISTTLASVGATLFCSPLL